LLLILPTSPSPRAALLAVLVTALRRLPPLRLKLRCMLLLPLTLKRR
jgi:hypothetical protein